MKSSHNFNSVAHFGFLRRSFPVGQDIDLLPMRMQASFMLVHVLNKKNPLSVEKGLDADVVASLRIKSLIWNIQGQLEYAIVSWDEYASVS